MARVRLPRREKAAYRRHETFMGRIREATTWKARLDHGRDYLVAALKDCDPAVAEQVAEQVAAELAEHARRITFGDDR